MDKNIPVSHQSTTLEQ